MQYQYFSGELDLKDNGKRAVTNTKRILDFARNNNVNVFHVAHVGGASSALFNPTSNEVKILNELKPIDHECIIEKTLPNSFYQTKLYDLLQLTGKKQLVVMGFASHMCITATTIAAFELGFENFICVDCCASRDLPLFSEVISAELMHKASMALLGDRYATLTSSAEAIGIV